MVSVTQCLGGRAPSIHPLKGVLEHVIGDGRAERHAVFSGRPK